MHNSIEPTDCIERLKTLPAETIPPYNWQEFQRRARLRTAPAWVATDWRPLAAAAALLLFVCAIVVWGRFGGGGRHVVVASGAIEDGAAAWGRGSDSTATADGWSKQTERPHFAGGRPKRMGRRRIVRGRRQQMGPQHVRVTGTSLRAKPWDQLQLP
jgi:hypothetical protein